MPLRSNNQSISLVSPNSTLTSTFLNKDEPLLNLINQIGICQNKLFNAGFSISYFVQLFAMRQPFPATRSMHILGVS